MRDGQPQIAKFLAEGLAGDAQEPCGLMLVAVGKLQHPGQQNRVQPLVNRAVKVARARFQQLLDEWLELKCCGRLGSLR